MLLVIDTQRSMATVFDTSGKKIEQRKYFNLILGPNTKNNQRPCDKRKRLLKT